MNKPGLDAHWEDDDEVSKIAARFYVRRRFGEWTSADETEFEAWVGRSFLHRAAYVRVEGIADRTDQVAAFRQSKGGGILPGGAASLLRRRFVIPLLAAASIAMFAAFGGPFIASLMQPSDRIDSTNVGGRTLLSFADNTQIELNTNTVMRFRMTTAERTVWLEKGEAWFRVAHNAAHPFTVIVGKHRVTDLGTEFLIRRDADDVDVTLYNGRASLSAQGVQTATLKPGDEAVATPVSLSVMHKTAEELADELAWRRGMLVFRNTPLAEVVKEFNRYNAIKLVIADPSIADERIYASLRTDDFDGFVQLAQMALNLRVEREGSTILLSRGQREETKRVVRSKRSP
jgi:transmembrane sensor